MGARVTGWRSVTAAMAAGLLLGAVVVGPVSAIRNGTIDGDDHPEVGLMTAHAANGDFLWRCTGTLIAPRVMLLAGHCTESPADHALVFFSNGLIVPDPDFTAETNSCAGIVGYPCTGANELAVTGSVHTH